MISDQAGLDPRVSHLLLARISSAIARSAKCARTAPRPAPVRTTRPLRARRLRAVAGMVFRYAIATGRASRDISFDLRFGKDHQAQSGMKNCASGGGWHSIDNRGGLPNLTR